MIDRPVATGSIVPRARGEELCTFVRRAAERGLVRAGWGIFSARLDTDRFIATSPHLDPETLTVDDLTCHPIDEAGGGFDAHQGHRSIFAARPWVQAVFEATPIHATAFAVCGQRLESRIIPESLVLLGDPDVLDLEMVQRDPAHLASSLSRDRPATLIRSRGVVVIGASMLEAFDRLEVLEATAEALLACRSMGPPTLLRDEDVAELRRRIRGELRETTEQLSD